MDYTKYNTKVFNKLNEYGASVYILRKGNEEYNEETNEYEGTDYRINGKGILRNFNFRNINGTTILNGDVQLMCVFDEKPLINDVVYIGEKNYTIVAINEVNPDGSNAIFYNIQGR